MSFNDSDNDDFPPDLINIEINSIEENKNVEEEVKKKKKKSIQYN